MGETRAEAEDLAERVEVEYEPLEAVVDPRAGSELSRWEKREGDVAGAFAAAAHVVRTDHVIPRLAAVPMEPRGAIASRDGGAPDRLVVVAERAPAARAAGADPRPARVGDPRDRPGRRRGLRLEGDAAGRDAASSRSPRCELGRPVKWAEDRLENFLVGAAGARAAGVGRARAGRRRPDPGAARADSGRPRRVPAAEHRDPAAHDRDAADRLLRHPERRGDRHRGAHEQGPDRALSRRRPARGDVPDRDDDRRRRPPAGHGRGRVAPPQPRPLVPLPDRARVDVRLGRLRALPRHRARAPVAARALAGRSARRPGPLRRRRSSAARRARGRPPPLRPSAGTCSSGSAWRCASSARAGCSSTRR